MSARGNSWQMVVILEGHQPLGYLPDLLLAGPESIKCIGEARLDLHMGPGGIGKKEGHDSHAERVNAVTAFAFHLSFFR